MAKEHISNESPVVEYGARRAIIVIGVLLATLMQTLDTTIVNVALPTIQGNLGATIDEAAWVVTGYIVAAVIVIPLTPWLQSRFGRRQYYATAIFGFTASSVLCGMAGSIEALIFWRIIQGLFGGGLVAVGQATLRDTFPARLIDVSQIVFALGALIGPALGPTLGGYFTDNFTWRDCFFVNVLPGLFAGIIVLVRLRNPAAPQKLRLDSVGLTLLALGLGSLQYVLEEGQRKDWFSDGYILLFATLAVFGIIGFIYWELRVSRNPIVDLRVLKHRSVWAGSLLFLAIGASLFGAIVILPQYTQGLLDFTASLSGNLILARALCIAILTPPTARLAASGKVDSRWLLIIGFGLLALSNYMLAKVTTSGTSFAALLPSQVIGGIGLGMLFIPTAVAVLSALNSQDAAKASSFTSLSLQLGGSLSTAALVTLIARRNEFHYEMLAGTATAHHFTGIQNVVHTHIMQLYGLVMQQAAAMSFADASFFLAALSACLAPLVFLLRKPKGGAHIAAGFD
jgi:DHA2 family multidrug resistance protein